MRVLVTGAAGFVGRYLCERLVADHELIAVDRQPGAGIAHALELPDDAGARALFARTRPEVVFHLAAFSSIADSELKQEQCRSVNVDGTRSLLRALPAAGGNCRFIYVSSCAVYGRVAASAQPITERAGGVGVGLREGAVEVDAHLGDQRARGLVERFVLRERVLELAEQRG